MKTLLVVAWGVWAVLVWNYRRHRWVYRNPYCRWCRRCGEQQEQWSDVVDVYPNLRFGDAARWETVYPGGRPGYPCSPRRG